MKTTVYIAEGFLFFNPESCWVDCDLTFTLIFEVEIAIVIQHLHVFIDALLESMDFCVQAVICVAI